MRHRIQDEFSGIDLGDRRLNERAEALSEALADSPAASFPSALGRGAELEACYRLLNNPRVEASAILEPHRKRTASRIGERGAVLLVHDTTVCTMPGEGEQLPRLQADSGARGFRCHLTLAVSADGRREPLGVVALTTFTRPDVAKARVHSKQRRSDDTRESKRWLHQSLVAEEQVGPGPLLIHVEDREGDIYESLAERTQRSMHFIIRGQLSRNILVGEDTTNIADFMRALPRAWSREVMLSRRQGPAKKRPKTSHVRRDGRVATLAVAAAAVRVRRPVADSKDSLSEIALNAVHVIEVDAPDGAEPVEWLLLTTEPIETQADVATVVDHYRSRWTIEEYFKALKTGCAYEARQLESYEALVRALSFFAVIAWQLLWLRFLAQNAPATSATAYATEDEIAVLQRRNLLRGQTVVDVLDAIAALGGHLKHNGPPGWQTLWRGRQRLETLAEGWALARSDQ